MGRLYGGMRRWIESLADSSGGPVGLRLRGLSVRESGQVFGWDDASFLDAFDLGDFAVVDGDLHGAEAEVFHAAADNFEPIVRAGGGVLGFVRERSAHGWWRWLRVGKGRRGIRQLDRPCV